MTTNNATTTYENNGNKATTSKATASRIYSGEVVSAKRQKTITVLIKRRIKHPLYNKVITRFKKYHVHDENNQYKVGDMVTIKEVCPIAKNKNFVVTGLLA